jgi:hypothetical protein
LSPSSYWQALLRSTDHRLRSRRVACRQPEVLEGIRGVAYGVGLLSVVAPTGFALFLFNQTLFLQIDFGKLGVLAGAVGGFALCCGLLTAISEEKQPENEDIRFQDEERFHGTLFLGAVFAGLCQFVTLGFVAWTRESDPSFGFRTWALVSILMSLGMPVLSYVGGVLNRRRRRRKAAPAETESEPTRS